ncbi:MAG TPA: fumarylacetoacetate hydrolase family protein [Chloroflexota bacterium]|nr:fumarylacetoacetate hydrolase family protein [Chloroflexota bacterium]
MKLVHFDDFRLGVLTDDERLVDVSGLVGGDTARPQQRLETLITGWQELRPTLERAAQGGSGVPVGQVRLRPAVPKPGQLACAAVNYLEEGRPEKGPFNAFLKSPTSIVGDGDTVELPDCEATVFHFEPELALVIGKRAAHLSERDALDHVFGYVSFIDGSARGLPGGFFLAKSWHTMAPVGPALVTADEVGDPNKLEVSLALNGQPRHTYSTSLMARHVPELLAEMTRVIALEPGDVVATGVHHTALFPVMGGDRISVKIEKLGPSLNVSVRDPKNRKWDR